MKQLEYLQNRNIKEDTIAEFGFAYRDNHGNLFCYNTDFNLKQQSQKLSFYNTTRFSNAYLYPIYDLYNEYIGFMCRNIDISNKPKFDGSSFPKAYHLYNLNKAYPFIIKYGFVIVVEGVFDVVALWQAGYKNCVAVLGTAFTEEHGCLLSRFCNKAILSFDNDEAGKKAVFYKDKKTGEIKGAKVILKSLNFEIEELNLKQELDDELAVNPKLLDYLYK